MALRCVLQSSRRVLHQSQQHMRHVAIHSSCISQAISPSLPLSSLSRGVRTAAAATSAAKPAKATTTTKSGTTATASSSSKNPVTSTASGASWVAPCIAHQFAASVPPSRNASSDRYWVAQCEVQWPGATPIAAVASSSQHCDIRFIQLFQDNYCYFVQCRHTGHTICIDPGTAAPVLRALQAWGWKLHTILLTHHHDDHIGGAAQVAAATGATIMGHDQGLARLPAGTVGVAANSSVALGASLTANIIATPGHTIDSIAYHLPSCKSVFVGDTLFAVGCGRLFEGTAVQMQSSLSSLAALPPATRVFCGHEYTQSNMRFAQSIAGYSSSDIRASRAAAITEWRHHGIPTIPSTIEMELATNPFMFTAHGNERRCAKLRDALDMDANASPAEIFAEVRRRKDGFQ